MLQLRQRIARGLYGGHRLRHAALAVGLGLLGGYLTGWNFSFAAVLAVAVLVNAHTRLLIASWTAGVALAALTSGATHFIGVAILDWSGVGRAVTILGDGPLAALWGWDQYELVGGAILASVLALPVARLATRITQSLAARGAIATVGTPGAGTDQVAPQRRLARCATRFLFGFTSRERACRREWSGGWLRPCGLPLAVLVVVAAGLAPDTIGSPLAARGLLKQLSKANGAEVAADDVELSLWTGRFAIRDLQVADAHHLHRDRLRVASVSGQLSPGALVRGRLQIEQITLDRVRVDVARHRLARSLAPHVPSADVRSVTDAALTVDTSVEIERYLRSWPSVRHDLEWLERLVAAVEAVSTAHSSQTAGGGSARPRRSDLGRPRPRVSIARLRAGDLPAGLQLGRKATLELTNVTSRPDLAKRPTRLKVVIPRLAAQLTARFALSDNAHRHTLKFSAEDLDLAEILDGRHDHQTLAAAGRLTLSGEGWMDRHHVELPLKIELTSLDVDLRASERLARVESDVWSQGLRRLGAVQADVLLSGPWSLVTLTVDPLRFVEQFKHQLRAAGEFHLVELIDDQLAESPMPESPTRVMQAAALESDPPASAGISELSDDGPDSEPGSGPAGDEMARSQLSRSEPASSEFAPSEVAGSDPADAAATGERLVNRDSADDEAAPLAERLSSSLAAEGAYPTTAAPYDEGDDYDARYDAPPPDAAPPPAQPAPVARPAQGSRRTAQLPGPVGLAVGHDPLDGPAQAPQHTPYHPVQYAPPRAEAARQPIPPAEPPEPPAAYGGEPRNVAPAYAGAPESAPYRNAPNSTAAYPTTAQPSTNYGTIEDDFAANGPADPEPDMDAAPPRVVRPSLLTRWSNGLRNRFARKPARSAEPEQTTVDPPDYQGQVFDAPAYEAASDDDPEKPLAADHPWYKRLFR